MKMLLIEGVRYHPFVVRYTLADGRRRRMTRWSPGFPWVRDEVGRELLDRFELDGIRAGSVSIRPAVNAPTRPRKRSLRRA